MLKEFTQNMNEVLRKEKVPDIKQFDLVLVPIVFSHHYYLLCFNIKDNMAAIIDNSACEEYEAKYLGCQKKQ
jgi:hypothetical protein